MHACSRPAPLSFLRPLSPGIREGREVITHQFPSSHPPAHCLTVVGNAKLISRKSQEPAQSTSKSNLRNLGNFTTPLGKSQSRVDKYTSLLTETAGIILNTTQKS